VPSCNHILQAVVMDEIMKATVQLAQDQYGNYGRSLSINRIQD
jgi:hypothetical protein